MMNPPQSWWGKAPIVEQAPVQQTANWWEKAPVEQSNQSATVEQSMAAAQQYAQRHAAAGVGTLPAQQPQEPRGMLGDIGVGLATGPSLAARNMLGGGLQMLGHQTGLPLLSEMGERAESYYGDVPQPETLAGQAASTVTGLPVYAGAPIAAGAAASGLGAGALGTTAATVGSGALSGFMAEGGGALIDSRQRLQMRREAGELDVDDDELEDMSQRTALGVGAIGALQGLPVFTAARPLIGPTLSKVASKSIAKLSNTRAGTALLTAAGEGSVEATIALMTHVMMDLNEDDPQAYKTLLQDAAFGALMGGLLGGGVGAITHTAGQARQETKQLQKKERERAELVSQVIEERVEQVDPADPTPTPVAEPLPIIDATPVADPTPATPNEDILGPVTDTGVIETQESFDYRPGDRPTREKVTQIREAIRGRKYRPGATVHTTSLDNLHSIAKQGVLPTEDADGGISVSASRVDTEGTITGGAASYGRKGVPVVLEFSDAVEAFDQGLGDTFVHSPESSYVRPEHIERVYIGDDPNPYTLQEALDKISGQPKPDPAPVQKPVETPTPEPTPRAALPEQMETGELRQEFAGQGRGHRKFANSLDTMVDEGTISPETREVALEAFFNTDDKLLSNIDARSSGKLKRAGNARWWTGMAKPARLQLRKRLEALRTAEDAPAHLKKWLNNPEILDLMVLLHEYAHIASYATLTTADKKLVNEAYRSKSRAGWKKFFNDGMSETDHSAKYFAKNADEFLVQSFAEWVLRDRVSDKRLKPLLERMGERLMNALNRLRGRPNVDAIVPIYEKMLAGKQLSAEDAGPMTISSAAEAGPVKRITFAEGAGPRKPDRPARTPEEVRRKLERSARPKLTPEEIAMLPDDTFGADVIPAEHTTLKDKAANFLKGAYDIVMDGLVKPEGTYKRPETWVQAKKDRLATKNKVYDELSWRLKQYNETLKDANFDPDSKRGQFTIKKVLQGQLDDSVLPEPVRKQVQEWRKAQDRESERYADALEAVGMDAQAKVVRDNIGTYLKEVPEWSMTLSGQIGSLVETWVPLRLSRSFRKVKRDAWVIQHRGKTVGKADTSQLAKQQAKEYMKDKGLSGKAAKEVRVLPPRSEMDRIRQDVTDPRVLMVKGITETSHDAQMLMLYAQVADEFSVTPPKGMKAEDVAQWAAENNLVEIPNLGKYHNLQGKFVQKEIAQDLESISHIPGGMMKFLQDYQTAWKTSKTVYSLPTVARNFISSGLYFAFLDRNSMVNPMNWRHYKKGIELLRQNTPERAAMIEEGLIGTEYVGAILSQTNRLAHKAGNFGGFMGRLQQVHGKASDLYRLGDTLFKAAGVAKKVDQGMSVKEAIDETKKWHQDYTEISRWARFIDRVPFGSAFVPFLDTTARIGVRAGKERPIRLAAVFAVPYIMNALGRAFIGMSEEEAELLDGERGWLERMFKPTMPFRDSYGKSLELDLSYTLPLSDTVLPRLQNGTLILPGITGGPLQNAAVEQITGRDLFTGREWDDNGLFSKERWSSLIANTAPVPSTAYWGPRRIKRAHTGVSREDPIYAWMGAVAGTNIRTPYIAEEAARAAARESFKAGDDKQTEHILELWNDHYKPDFLQNLTWRSVARGVRSSRSRRRNTARRKAAEFLLQGSTGQVERAIRKYNEDLEEQDVPLSLEEVEQYADIFMEKGKTR